MIAIDLSLHHPNDGDSSCLKVSCQVRIAALKLLSSLNPEPVRVQAITKRHFAENHPGGNRFVRKSVISQNDLKLPF